MDKKIAGIPHENRGELPADRPCRMACREEVMIGMNQIDQIKELQRQGYGPKEIAARLGIDRKTSSKYMLQEDYSVSVKEQRQLPSKLDRWKPQIEQWLEEDQRMRFKQRHTAKRIHNRLVAEHPGEYMCSYPLVQRYVKQRKERRKESEGYLELVWAPGEAQADFGEADLIEAGVKRTVKYLTMSFPCSNGGYLQTFGGETAECVAQGLLDIFDHIEGVPTRIVFDNASGVGRRIRDRVILAELFLRFKCHYGFSVSFCNPASGHEKGHVENKVGYMRRNFFVPIPVVESLESWNEQLLALAEKDFKRPHYKKGLEIAELFKEERRHLGPLPAKPFSVERFSRVHTDGYGKFCIDGRHWYSSCPEFASRELTVGIKAHSIVVYRESGEVFCTHRRAYGESRSDTSDYLTSLETLVKKPGAWLNSALRAGVNEPTREALDALDRTDLRRVLAVLAKSVVTFGFDIAVASLDEALRRGALDAFSLQAVSARLAFHGLQTPAEAGPDLGAYDRVLISHAAGRP
jgi:transposase